ncbi:universal stress protein [uncultured Dokdonia sp.]|uniref:universal stress protein n=1 Tax=uncultured Dokdonia sp. TaxID=575653 RepID=UPI00261C4BBA|nr:universal stress protein [uncultured Dokdonia sp.]
MKNILVPIGSSNSAITTLQYAIDLAEQVDANVYVISVFQEFSKVGGMSKVNTLLKEESEKRIDAVLKSVNKKNVSVIAHPIKGEILEGVKRFNKHVPVDLMIISPRSNSQREDVYLGKTSGKLVKETNIPVLVIPENETFKVPKKILMAFKDGKYSRKKSLEPIYKLQKLFKIKIHLLHVETPDSTPEMLEVSDKLKKISASYTKTKNATTYQGVLEHFQSNEPDMICVVRRKRGFFKKLWEANAVLKRDFFTTKPLLILRVKE